MTRRVAAAIILVAGIMALPNGAAAQGAKPAAKSAAVVTKWPDRPIHHEIPLTNMIKRAFAAGTRDSSGAPGKRYWQTWMDYTINARLDSATHVVSGRETVVFKNNSDTSIANIRLRLYQNVFEPHNVRARVVEEVTYGMHVTKLAVNGQPVDLNPPAGGRGGRGGFAGGRGGAPDPAAGPRVPTVSGLASTVATITLATPVPAKGSVTIDAEWDFAVPNANARGLRMGRWADSLYEVAQWYPQVAVYDDLRGWDTELYLGDTEFYNNFGRFDVRIDVPAGWIVGATGVLQNPQEVLTATARDRLSHVLESDSQRNIVSADERGPGKSTMPGTRLVWHFIADTSGDFAWGTSDRYVWDATRATIPGKGPIPVNLLYEPGHAASYATGGPIVRHALEFYSKLWMPYAFPLMTVVDGPEGGMEYPMFIMSSIGASDHEAGHEWWPMMVGTNETWYGFMDEGFNQYMNALSTADRVTLGIGTGRGGAGGGGRAGNAPGVVNAPPGAAVVTTGRAGAPVLTTSGGGGGGGGRGAACTSRTMNPPGGVGVLNCNGQSFGAQSGDESYAMLMWNANYGGPRYQDQAYGRAPKMLSMLGGIVGDSAVWHAMSGYAKAWLFKHPTPWDYAFFMSRALKQDLGWFWYYWLYTTESVEGSIQDVKSVGPATTVTVRQDGQMPSPVVLKVEFAPKGAAIRQMKNSVKLDSASALVTFPVDVWFNGSKTFKAALNFGGRKIEKITLDPYGRFPDKDVTDNVWPRQPKPPVTP